VKNLLIVEESLKNQKAHWYSYISVIEAAARKQQWHVDVACHAKVEEVIRQNLQCFPIFKKSVYLDRSESYWIGERYYGFLTHSAGVIRSMWSFLSRKHKYDAIFVPTVLVHHLIAWLVLVYLHPKIASKVTLFFVSHPGIWDKALRKGRIPRSSLLQKLLLRLFRSKIEQKKVRFAVETRTAQFEYEALTGLSFELLPHPVPQVVATPKPTNHAFTFSSFGFARHEKGSDLIQSALLELASNEGAKFRFLIQWVDSFKMPDGSVCDSASLKVLKDNVQVISTPLNETEYEEYLNATSCMVLPYRNSSYYARVSRVAIEAVCKGIPLIYTKGGWLEELVTRLGAGIGIEDEDVVGLIEGLIEMKSKYPEFRNIALMRSETAKAYYSPDSFVKILLTSKPTY